MLKIRATLKKPVNAVLATLLLSTSYAQADTQYPGFENGGDVVQVQEIEDLASKSSISDVLGGLTGSSSPSSIAKSVTGISGGLKSLGGIIENPLTSKAGGISSGSISSGVGSMSNSGGVFVTGYCSSSGPIASNMSLVSGLTWLNSSHGSQISNATNILSQVVTSEIQKASKLNTETLNKNQTVKDKQFEADVNYQTRLMKDKDKIEADRALAEKYDVNKLNTTNTCAQPGVVHRQNVGHEVVKQTAGSMTQMSRNYNRSMVRATNIADIQEPLLENKHYLDDITPITNTEPRTINEEELSKESYLNNLIINPKPAPELTGDYDKTASGKQYSAFKGIHDKKVEAAVNVLHQYSARDLNTISIPYDDENMSNLIDYLSLDKKKLTGFKDKDGKVLEESQVIDGKVSLSVWEELQVGQYHNNPNWQGTLVQNFGSSTAEELKLSALQLHFIYELLKEVRLSNKLLALNLQSSTQKESIELNKAHSMIVAQ